MYLCLKVPLKRNFRMWDFCLVIKFQPYFGNTAHFFFAYGKRKLLFQPFEVGWLSPNWRPSWRGQNSLVTWNRKMIGTLNQMASTQLKNICSQKVKKTYKQEKVAFESIIRSSGASTFRVASLRGNRTLCEVHLGRDCVTVTISPVVSATSYKSSQH